MTDTFKDIAKKIGLPVLPLAWSGVVGTSIQAQAEREELDFDERALLYGLPSGRRPMGVISVAGFPGNPLGRVRLVSA